MTSFVKTDLKEAKLLINGLVGRKKIVKVGLKPAKGGQNWSKHQNKFVKFGPN